MGSLIPYQTQCLIDVSVSSSYAVSASLILFGVVGSVGDTVWLDLNGNGMFDIDEEGIEGVTVILEDRNGMEVVRTQTNSSGLYLFTDLLDRDFRVRVTPPPGLVATFDLDGEMDNVASFSLLHAENKLDVDFGLQRE